jgi:hypothetical protein
MAWTLVAFVAEMVGDAFITGGMIYYLRRSRTVFEKYVTSHILVTLRLRGNAAPTRHSTNSSLIPSTQGL